MNSKDIQERETRSMAMRKLIINASKSTADSSVAKEALDAQSIAYNEHLMKLGKFRKKSKTTSQRDAHKTLWSNEFDYLVKQEHLLEKEIALSLGDFSLREPIFAAEVTEMIDASNASDLERKKEKNSFRKQLREMKDLLMSMKVKKSSPKNSNVEDFSTLYSGLLLRIKLSLESQAENLLKTGKAFESDIIDVHNSVLHCIDVDDRNAKQIFFDRLVVCREEDDEELKGFQSLLRAKFTALTNSFESQIQFIDNSITSLRGNLEDSVRASTDSEPICNFITLPPQDFVVFRKIYRFSTQKGLPRSDLLKTLQLNLPHLTAGELNLCERRCRMQKSLQLQRSVLKRKADKVITDFLACAEKDIAEFRALKEEEQVNHEISMARNIRQEELHEQLSEHRQWKEREEMTSLEQAARDRLRREEEEEKEKRKEDKRRAGLKQRIYAYQQEAALINVKLEEERRKEEEETRSRLKTLIEEHKPHVERRQALFKERTARRAEAEGQQRLKLEEQRLALVRLSEQVPYFDAIQNAKADVTHLTAAARGHEYTKAEELSRGFIPTYGLLDERIIRDVRFRLGVALREANLHTTAAGRDMVLRAHPRPQLAIHGILS